MSESHIRAFVDTNIILDAAMQRQPFAEAANAIFTAGMDERIWVQVAATSLKDLYYIYSKQFGQAKAHGQVQNFMEFCTVCAIDFPVCQDALHSDEKDFEDALIMTSAAFEFSDFLITRDKDGFQGSEVRTITPEDFVRLML